MTKLFVALLAGILLVGCGAPPPAGPSPASQAEPERYQLRGEVLELRTADVQAAVIKHEDIVGLMDAMTMTFPVPNAEDFAKLHVGDYITADVINNPQDGVYLENIQVVEPPPAADSAETEQAMP